MPVIRVFLTTIATDPDDPRLHLARAAYAWWSRQPDCLVTMQHLEGVEGSQRLRHLLAYQSWQAAPDRPYYILADDDIFPYACIGKRGPDALPHVLAWMDAHPAVTMCQPHLLNPHHGMLELPEYVVGTIGGCRVVRGAAMQALLGHGGLPPLNPILRGGYDHTLCVALSDATPDGTTGTYTPWWAVHAGWDCSSLRPRAAGVPGAWSGRT